ncbi:MAG: carboxypeptidase regulatory-like domain-containing protein [Bryobacterales bacterium]|nr:carboxypeptidase regulatory-like domain-containing protein [Bryobacterales bacterium]
MTRFVLLLVSMGLAAYAQVQSGTIVGTVTDQGGAAVGGARVTLVNDGTRFTRTVETGTTGQYVATSVPTGVYSITAEMPGFQKLVTSGLQLTAADTLTVDLKLQVGNVQETIEVKETAPLLQSQTAAVSSLVSNQQMIEMPLNGRTFTALLKLSPGAYTGSSGNLATSQYAMRGDVNISVNGSSAQNNTYLIDGVVNRNLWLSTLIMVPTVDSIQEVRMMTSNYTAEYGAAAGAITIVQTKSGTNQVHGSLYEFLRNNRLDANTFFNNRLGAPRPAFRRNEFGGTVGGPIRKDKTFFFADYQGIRVRQPRSTISTIPTLAQRQMITTGNFSNFGATIYDPTVAVNGQRQPFAGNLIPATRLDPAALRVTSLLPDPTSSAATRNFVFNPTLQQRTDQFDVRLDHNLGQSDRVFFKYSYDDTLLLTPGNVPVGGNAQNVPISPYLSSDGTDTGTETPLKNWSATFNYVKVIGANIVNEVRLGAVRWNQYISPIGNAFATANALGIPGVNINDKSGGLPSMAITGYRNLGDASTYPENSQTVSFQYEDILTIVKNSHTLKFGGQYVNHRFNGFSAFPTRGTFDFNGQYTRQIGTTGAANALADWALGAVSATNRNVLVGTFGMRFYNFNAFFDDSWRVTNRLTLNYGVRYELLTPPYEVYDRWANFNVTTAQLEIAGRDGASRRLRNVDTNNLAPRLGITYMLTSDRRTVLRAGFGSSFVEAGQGGGQLYKNLPFFFSNVLATDQNAAPVRRLSQGLDAPVAPDLNNKVQLSSGNPAAWDYGLKSTNTMQWSLGIQREVLQDLLVDVSYVGTRTLGLIANVNINQSFPGPGAQPQRRPFFSLNPNVTNITYRTNFGAAKYHALQTRVEKRARGGLTLSLAYTWSHFLSNGGNINGGGNAPPQDARCYSCEWGSMPEDRRHLAVFNHVWELPFGKGRKFVTTGPAALILGGWRLNGIWSMSTGGHFTATAAAAVSNSAGGGGDRPNRIADGNLSSGQRTIDRWFDLTAFATPAQFTFGNSGRGILVGPGNFNVDAGIHRQFALGERYKLTFRWEMFNAFNRANFGNPNSAIGNPQAGQISGTAPARIQQAALKFVF